MIVELQLRAVGVGLILLAILHAFFPRRFGWRSDLANLTLLNRQIFYVHTLFIAATVAFFGILSIISADMLGAGGPLLIALMAGFSLFWLLRLVIQLFVFDRSLWKGQRLNTTIHIVFTILWTYLTSLYGWICWSLIR